MSNTQRVTIILNGPNDWSEWIEIVKTKAKAGEIWEFVDPSTVKTALPAFNEPTLPRPANVNPAKTTISNLDADEKEELQVLRQDYKQKSRRYEQQRAALGNLRIHIQETISRTYLPYTFNCETPHDMLTALKQRAAPTDRARKMELVNQYRKMMKTPKDQSIEPWLQEWEKVYTECKKMKLPEVEEERPLFDFLTSISRISPEFTNAWMIDIQRMQDKGDDLPDLYKMVELFRNNQRLLYAQRDLPHSAFAASYQGRSADSDSKPKRACLCGVDHRWRECPYLIDSVRLPDWKPDPDIQQQIEGKINANAGLKAAITHAQTQAVMEAAKRQEDMEKEKDSNPSVVEKPAAGAARPSKF